jgi:hypothetical protein
MKNFTALFTIAAAVALLCLPASVAAGDSTSVTILPEGTLHSGDSVFGSLVLITTEPFTDEDTVTMETDLENSAWTYIVEVNGVDRVSAGIRLGSVTIPRHELTYPSAQNITIRANFSGTAPVVTEEKYITVVTVCSSHTYPNHATRGCSGVSRGIEPA